MRMMLLPICSVILLSILRVSPVHSQEIYFNARTTDSDDSRISEEVQENHEVDVMENESAEEGQVNDKESVLQEPALQESDLNVARSAKEDQNQFLKFLIDNANSFYIPATNNKDTGKNKNLLTNDDHALQASHITNFKQNVGFLIVSIIHGEKSGSSGGLGEGHDAESGDQNACKTTKFRNSPECKQKQQRKPPSTLNTVLTKIGSLLVNKNRKSIIGNDYGENPSLYFFKTELDE